MFGLCDPFPGNEQERKFVEESNRAMRRKYALGEYAFEYVCIGEEYLCLTRHSRIRCRRCSLEGRRAQVREEVAWLEAVWAKEEQEIFRLVSEWKKRKREEEEAEEKEKEEEEAEERKFREEERRWIEAQGEDSEAGSDDTIPAKDASDDTIPAQDPIPAQVQSSPRPGPAQSESQTRVLDQILDTPPSSSSTWTRPHPGRAPTTIPDTPSTPEDIWAMVDGFNRAPITPGCFSDWRGWAPPEPEPGTSVRRNWGLKRRCAGTGD